MKPLILSYGQRTPAKSGIVSGYYEEDIRKLEEIVYRAADNKPIDRQLTRLIADGVDLGVQSGKEITALRRALSGLKLELADKDRRIAELEAPKILEHRRKSFLSKIRGKI